MQWLKGSRFVPGPLYKATLLMAPVFFLAVKGRGVALGNRDLGCLFLNYVLFLSFAYAANDWADRLADAAAGKVRCVGRFAPWQAVLLLCGLAAANYAVASFMRAPTAYYSWLTLGLLLCIAYSIPPGRLKSRGFWGLISAPLLGKTIPLMMACAYAGQKGWWLPVLAAADLIKCGIDILFHQVVDFDADRMTGTRTVAVMYGSARAQRWLASLAAVGSAAAVCVTVLYATMVPEFRWVAAAGAAGFGPALTAARRWAAVHPSALTNLLPRHYVLLGAFCFMLAPLWFAGIASWRDSRYLPWAAVMLLLSAGQLRFYGNYRYR